MRSNATIARETLRKTDEVVWRIREEDWDQIDDRFTKAIEALKEVPQRHRERQREKSLAWFKEEKENWNKEMRDLKKRMNDRKYTLYCEKMWQSKRYTRLVELNKAEEALRKMEEMFRKKTDSIRGLPLPLRSKAVKELWEELGPERIDLRQT
jgi:hypothetical protein